MKVLILYQFSNHTQTINSLCANLIKRGIKASSYNIVNWNYSNMHSKKRKLWLSFFYILGFIPFLNGLMLILFRYKTILKLADNYNIIDIHFFSPYYDKIIKKLKERGKKVKITVWGSDFYRVSKTRHEEQRKIYHIIDLIQIETSQIAEDFLKVFPEFEEKIRIAHFGLTQFEIMDEQLKKGSPDLYRKELKIPEDRIVITCGTNRSEGQQHLKIIESIERLSPEIKERLFLVFPLTYGGDKFYFKMIIKKINASGIPHKIISSFLPVNDLVKMILLSDILITIQVTDALSCTIQEYLYGGSIIITGDWLPYGILKDHGIFFLTTSLDKLSETLSETIQNFETLKKSCAGNKDKLTSLSSWNEAIKEWLAIYAELDNELINKG